MKKPFLKTGLLGLVVVGMSVVLIIVFPSEAPWMMDGFFTPIIAFEFVQTTEEVYRLFGPANSPEQQAMIHAMDMGNRLDYIYLVLYASFLFLFSSTCAVTTGNKRYYSSGILAVLVLIGDAFENIQLLKILSKINISEFTYEITLLHRFTWMKWGGIAAVFLTLSPYFLKGRKYSKLVGIAGISSAFVTCLAYLNRSVLTEIMGLSVAFTFILMILYCFMYKINGE